MLTILLLSLLEWPLLMMLTGNLAAGPGKFRLIEMPFASYERGKTSDSNSNNNSNNNASSTCSQRLKQLDGATDKTDKCVFNWSMAAKRLSAVTLASRRVPPRPKCICISLL